MSDDDMPDLMAGPGAVAGGTADDILDENDEMDAMLEEAMEETEAEEAAPPKPGPLKPQPQLRHRLVRQVRTPKTVSPPPPPLFSPLFLAPAAPASILDTTQNALEAMPRTSEGLIDVDSLSPEQHRAYTAAIMSVLTEEQQQRYELYRRSSLKEPMKRLVQAVTGSKPEAQNRILIALSSVTKSFVGELVEEARRVATAEGDAGPLQPGHLLEAYQRLAAAGLVESVETERPKLRL